MNHCASLGTHLFGPKPYCVLWPRCILTSATAPAGTRCNRLPRRRSPASQRFDYLLGAGAVRLYAFDLFGQHVRRYSAVENGHVLTPFQRRLYLVTAYELGSPEDKPLSSGVSPFDVLDHAASVCGLDSQPRPQPVQGGEKQPTRGPAFTDHVHLLDLFAQ